MVEESDGESQTIEADDTNGVKPTEPLVECDGDQAHRPRTCVTAARDRTIARGRGFDRTRLTIDLEGDERGNEGVHRGSVGRPLRGTERTLGC